jgi:BUD22
MEKKRRTDQVKDVDESKYEKPGIREPKRTTKLHRFSRMYEKLYGEEANHVKAQAEAERVKEERKLARQMKKSASGGNNMTLGKRRSNASNPSQAAKANASTEQLHPSWEAKKQQKDLMAKALSGAGGLGNKKIVFDDSD